MTDTDKLRAAIENSGLKQSYLAKNLGISTAGLRNKLKNRTEFKASEIETLGKILNLTSQETFRIFFRRPT